MSKASKVYIAGHCGLAGSPIVTRMHELGWREKVGLPEGIVTAYAEFSRRGSSR